MPAPGQPSMSQIGREFVQQKSAEPVGKGEALKGPPQ